MLMLCKSRSQTCWIVGLFVSISVSIQACSFLEAQNPIESGTFELWVHGLASPSIARLTPNELSVQDPAGSITRYQRAPRYDTTDQLLLGYSSRQAQQVIRWPANNAGRMQIGTLQNGLVQFAWSKLTISASQHQVVPNPPLSPTTARITNSHSDTLIVLVADRRKPQQLQRIRIPSRGSERVQLDRDAGATLVETVETMDAFGNWQQRQFKTPIPPSVLYDMSVYEEFLQSIAIDRTGKSPNPIEDINYQPRGVGFFIVPPGDNLPSLADIDAYRIADDAQNPFAVRKLSQRELERNSAAPATDPLKDLLKKFQKQRGVF